MDENGGTESACLTCNVVWEFKNNKNATETVKEISNVLWPRCHYWLLNLRDESKSDFNHTLRELVECNSC